MNYYCYVLFLYLRSYYEFFFGGGEYFYYLFEHYLYNKRIFDTI